MEPLSALSSMALYALTMAIVVLINFPGVWRPLLSRVTLLFCRTTRPKQIYAYETQRVPSTSETAVSSDPTIESLVETSEESEKKKYQRTIHERSSVSSKPSSLSPETRKNVRFGSLSSINEKSPDESSKDLAVADSGKKQEDMLKSSIHSTRSTASRVSFSATTEVIPRTVKPPVIKTAASAPPTFNLDSIKSRRLPLHQQATNTSEQSLSMASSLSGSDPAVATLSSIPWMVDHAATSTSSTKEEDSNTSMTGSDGRIHATGSDTSNTHADGSTHSRLSSRLRSRLTQGPKRLGAKTKESSGDKSLLISNPHLDTDSMPSSLSSDVLDRLSKNAPSYII